MTLRWLAASLCIGACAAPPPTTTATRPDCPRVPRHVDPIIITLADGRRGKIESGVAYEEVNGSWREVEKSFSPDWFETAYAVDASCSVSRRADDGTLYPVRSAMAEPFDGVTDVLNLFGPDRGWTGFTLQSPLAPEVRDYVALRGCLLNRTCDFRDNRIEMKEEPGRGAFLRATSVPKSPAMVTAKSSFETTLAYFVKGDDVWFRAKFRVVEGRPFSLFDLEGTFMNHAPGPRLVLLAEDGQPPRLGVELKALDKPTWKQARAFPLGAWVDVEVHFRLDDDPAGGLVEVWQDGEQLISASGRTMPISDMVLDSIEVGVTASDHLAGNTVVDVDDVRVGLQRGQ